MKRFLVLLTFCLAGLASFAQQKGDMALGFNFGVAPVVENHASMTNFGLGAKFRYNVSNPVRLEANLGYWFKSQTIDVIELSANVHYVFKVGNKFNIYPLLGVGYARVNSSIGGAIEDAWNEYDWDDWGDDLEINASTGFNRLLVNVGVGAEYAVTDKLSLGVEIKYQYMQDFSRLPINFGLAYKF